jgi:predicted DsbA family dithiol-disulfide isomerase
MTAATMTAYHIKVVSDVICPWVSTKYSDLRDTYAHVRRCQCYLGQKRLQRAIALHQNALPTASSDTFKVTWHPFYLDPTLPKVGVDNTERLRKKFGPERLARVREILTRLGEAEGIHFTWNGKVGNTRDAHRLVQLAKNTSNDTENKLVAELFKTQFEEGADLTSEAVLLEAADRAGLDKTDAQTWLRKGSGGKEVDAEVEEAYLEGISGVPHFLINGRYGVGGAQDVQVFLEIFSKIKQGELGHGSVVSPEAGSC